MIKYDKKNNFFLYFRLEFELVAILKSVNILVEDLISLHDSFSKDFLNQYEKPLNLKKLLISEVFVQEQSIILPSFLDYVLDYHNKLGQLMASIELEFQYDYMDCRTRIKQKDSIINKLVYYRDGKSEQGKVPVKKCLNDLFGVRIILDEFEHNELSDLCQVQDNVKCIDSSKNGYRASHIYFHGKSNEYFPWELQIWRKPDVLNNELSHKEHKSKRRYIEWPRMYIASGKESN